MIIQRKKNINNSYNCLTQQLPFQNYYGKISSDQKLLFQSILSFQQIMIKKFLKITVSFVFEKFQKQILQILHDFFLYKIIERFSKYLSQEIITSINLNRQYIQKQTIMMSDPAILEQQNPIQQNVRDSRQVDLHRLIRQGDRIIKELKEKTQTSMLKDYSKDAKNSVPRANCSSVDSASGRHAGRLRVSPNSPENTLNSRNNAQRSSRKQLLSPKNDHSCSTKTQLIENTQRFLYSGRTVSPPFQQKLELKLADIQYGDNPAPSINFTDSIEENKKLKEYNRELQELVAYLQKSLKDYEGIINRYRQTIQQKEQETETVKQHSTVMITKYEQQTRKLNLMLDERKKKCSDLEKAVEESHNQNLQLRDQIVHLHQKFAKKVKKMKQKNSEMRQQQGNRIDQYQKELQVISASKFRIEKDYSLLQSHIDTLKEEIDQKYIEISNLKEILTQKCDRIIELEQLRRIQQSEARQKDNKNSLENKILVSANQQLYGQIARYEQNSAKQSAEKELNLIAELSQTRNKILMYEENINRLSSEIQSCRVGRVAERVQIEQLRKVIQIKEQEFREIKKNNFELEGKLVSQSADVCKLSIIEEMNNEILELRSENEKLTEFISALQKTEVNMSLSAQQDNSSEPDRKVTKIENGIFDVHEKLENETERKAEFRKGYKELQKKADLLDKQLQNLRVNYEHDQSDKKQLQFSLQEVKRQNAKLRQEIDELNEMYSHMQGQIDTLHINRSPQSWQERLEDKNSMEALLKARERQIGELQERVKSQVEKYNRLLENSTAEFDSLMGLNCELSEKLLSCEQELQVLKGHKLQPLEHSEIQMLGASKMSKNTIGFLTSQENDEEVRLSLNQLTTQNRQLKQNIRCLKRQIQSMEDDIRFERRRNNHLEAIFTKTKSTTEYQQGPREESVPSHDLTN